MESRSFLMCSFMFRCWCSVMKHQNHDITLFSFNVMLLGLIIMQWQYITMVWDYNIFSCGSTMTFRDLFSMMGDYVYMWLFLYVVTSLCGYFFMWLFLYVVSSWWGYFFMWLLLYVVLFLYVVSSWWGYFLRYMPLVPGNLGASENLGLTKWKHCVF